MQMLAVRQAIAVWVNSLLEMYRNGTVYKKDHDILLGIVHRSMAVVYYGMQMVQHKENEED